ncbi:septum formation protein [Lutibacter oricola]|uniref:dTTP/UTP pyrophosphatase n=1 Tax=Lutibacter oricola TaxID=762486 RepID=A0A1H2XL82_9FLAO|nr:Maf family nucleotide pyrophosphatase [Lutibacter oricola]SDW93632.1 septum formation protein [Lutibacter oricola]
MLQEKFKNNTIILASNSPRRQELIKGLDVNFKIEVKEVNELYSSNLKNKEITEYLAVLKSNAFGEVSEKDIIITADTIVWFNNKALEKPKTKEEAIEMLSKLSGKKHEVYTSVCIRTNNTQKVFTDITKVHFANLSLDEITYYVNKYKPFDKAGSYGIQEWLGYVGVSKIEGSYFNVMGLPVDKIYQELKKL